MVFLPKTFITNFLIFVRRHQCYWQQAGKVLADSQLIKLLRS